LVKSLMPGSADKFLEAPAAAAQREAEDQKKIINDIWSGMDVDLPEGNVNVQVRLEVMTDWMQGSEAIPATDVQARLQSDGPFRARVEKIMKQLQMKDAQERNAKEFGILGTAAGNL